MGNDAEFVGGGVGSCRTCRTGLTGPTCLTGLTCPTCLTCPTGPTGLTDLMCPTILLFTRHFSLLDNPKASLARKGFLKRLAVMLFFVFAV